MANYESLKSAIQQVVRTNGNNEITGILLQQTLFAMVNSLGAGYQYLGIATPTTNPGTPDQNVFYVASTAGTYSNFGGFILNSGEIAIFKYNGNWTKDITGIASAEKLNQVSTEIVGIIGEAGSVVSGYSIIPNEYVVAGNGSFASFNGWSRTDYVPIGNYSGIVISGANSGYNWLYDENKNPVSQVNLAFGPNVNLLQYPTAKYIVISDTNANMANLVITVSGYKNVNLTSLDGRVRAVESQVSAMLQNIDNLIAAASSGYKLSGVVFPTDSPKSGGLSKLFYIAKENGVYQNFGGLSIDDEVAILYNVENSPNLLDLTTLIPNKYIDAQGQVADAASWSASQRMNIVSGTTYKVVASVNGSWETRGSVWYAFYDANGDMTHRGVTTLNVMMEALAGDVTLAVSWDTNTIGETPMVVASDFVPTGYEDPNGWRKVSLFELQKENTQIVLPSKIAFLQDKQFDVMVNNILYRGSSKAVGFKRLGSSTLYATQYEDRFRINQPNVVNDGTATFMIQLKNDCAFDKLPAQQENIISKTISFNSVSKTQGSGTTKKVLFIGDSITANGVYAREIVNLFANDDMAVQLIGTLGESPANHEGRGGWSAKDYCTKASYNDYTNAFWNPSTQKFDFSYYMSHNGFAGVDFVFITLGINDVYSQTKPLSENKYSEILSYYNEIVTSIRAYNANIKLFIGLPIMPANSAFSNSYNHDIIKAERLGLIQRLIQQYENRENNGFVLVPIYCVVDTERDFPTEERAICARDNTLVEYVTDETHPKTQGYYKIADVMFTYIKYGTTL